MGRKPKVETPPPAQVGATPEETRVPVPEPSETPPRRKRGRPPGSKTKARELEQQAQEAAALAAARQSWQAEGEVIGREMLPLLEVGSGYIGSRWGERYALSGEEKERLGSAVGTIVAKHQPTWTKHYAEELALAWALLSIVGARVMLMLAEDAKPVDTKVVEG